ncbi:MAG: 2'-5' RNA ligase family protein [Myxococcales bacterium]|nr:2'-5' RNA ligase family protein [Myxococcales bacterium]
MTVPKGPPDRGAPAPKKSKKRLGSIIPRAHCYVGLSIPIAAANALADLQRRLAPLCDEHFVVRWVPATIAHLTLRYLGRYDPAVLEAVEDELKRELSPLAPVPFAFSGLRLMPDPAEPEFVWLGAEVDRSYNMLCQRLDLALAELGFEAQSAPEMHLTLGIVCSGHPNDAFLAELERLQRNAAVRTILDDVILFTSSWADAQPSFEIRRRVKLTGSGRLAVSNEDEDDGAEASAGDLASNDAEAPRDEGTPSDEATPSDEEAPRPRPDDSTDDGVDESRETRDRDSSSRVASDRQIPAL